MELSLGLINADIKTAEYALNDYKNSKSKDIKNICAYHIQQASEKLIKYQIYQNMKQPGNREMYTHDIGKLLRYVKTNNISIIIPDYITQNEDTITAWEAGSRYDLHL